MYLERGIAMVAFRSHKPKVVGSSPAPAIEFPEKPGLPCAKAPRRLEPWEKLGRIATMTAESCDVRPFFIWR